jgi:hypothetical protein
MRSLLVPVVICLTALARSGCSWISQYSDTSVRVENASDAEQPLSRGRFTYRLTVGTAFNGQSYLNLEFVTDRSLDKDVATIVLAFVGIALGLFVWYVVSARDKKERPTA